MLSTFTRRCVTLGAAAVAATALTVVPAQANDVTKTFTRNGVALARATWDDSIDTLCITVLAGGSDAFAQVGIRSTQGLSEPERDPRVASTTKRQGRYCTPNLKIREDAPYEMQIQWRNRLDRPDELYNSGLTRFYT